MILYMWNITALSTNSLFLEEVRVPVTQATRSQLTRLLFSNAVAMEILLAYMSGRNWHR